MRKKILASLIAALLAQAVPPSALYAQGLPQNPFQGSVNLPNLGDDAGLTLAEEKRLGERIMQGVFRDPDYLDDPVLLAYVHETWRQLLQAGLQTKEIAPELAQHYRFSAFLVRDASINAFALPGGWMGAHTGLIAALERQDELAAVLGHELAHLTQRHIARSTSKASAQTPWLLAGLVLAALAARSKSGSADDVLGAAVAGTQALAVQGQLNFSRDMEREADRLGLALMQAAGFDPAAAVSVFEKMQNAAKLNDYGQYPYLRSHPLTTERIAEMQTRQAGFGRSSAGGHEGHRGHGHDAGHGAGHSHSHSHSAAAPRETGGGVGPLAAGRRTSGDWLGSGWLGRGGGSEFGGVGGVGGFGGEAGVNRPSSGQNGLAAKPDEASRWVHSLMAARAKVLHADSDARKSLAAAPLLATFAAQSRIQQAAALYAALLAGQSGLAGQASQTGAAETRLRAQWLKNYQDLHTLTETDPNARALTQLLGLELGMDLGLGLGVVLKGGGATERGFWPLNQESGVPAWLARAQRVFYTERLVLWCKAHASPRCLPELEQNAERLALGVRTSPQDAGLLQAQKQTFEALSAAAAARQPEAAARYKLQELLAQSQQLHATLNLSGAVDTLRGAHNLTQTLSPSLQDATRTEQAVVSSRLAQYMAELKEFERRKDRE